ncbi:MAG: UDP-N-acetylglucosamine--N-acetylmuramyl-(pentapeptide) pyrophosphoryl-undecaprenol N-acetylglucosamine transferase [Oscillospiraceae bacterium]|nr:UDP-N-acetylglucosamine--N-acetylmuramyl-(pentapeptide) pyrophosphoryl-undecaprenol N-acetylglucosamine transferase [Oscillospiraceae bacterium]
MKFVLTCGGTAGHINPAIAVAQRLREIVPECEILFIGAEGKMEMDLVPREGFEIVPLRVTNLSRGIHLADIGHNIHSLKNVIESGHEAKRILKEFRPDAVLGTGGYVCYPVLHEAAKLGIPTLVHESNAVPGLTTRMLADHVSCVLLGYEESRQHYPAAADVRVTGTPVRGKFSIYTKELAKEELGIAPDMPLVVSMWGSLGSGHMNETLVKMLPLMKNQKDFRMIHATGSYYYQDVTKKLQDAGVDTVDCNTDVREYIYDAARVLCAADLVLCRAGASTLSELSSIGKPALIVPSPNVTNHHQEKNARLVERAGGAKVLLEGEFDEASFLAEIRKLVSDSETLSAMSRSMLDLAVPDALDQIVDTVLEYARKGRTKK